MTQTHSEQTARGEVELKACPNPWCTASKPSWYLTGHHVVIRCQCGMRGPERHTEAEAIIAWNDRPSLSPADNGALGEVKSISVAEEWSAYMDEAVSKAPEPLKQLGEYLAGLLDEDQWKTAERYLNAAAISTTPDAVRGEVVIAWLYERNDGQYSFVEKNRWGVLDAEGPLGYTETPLVRATLHPSPEAPIEGQDVELRKAANNLRPYLEWTIGPESPGCHPTMPSAVAAFLAALRAPVERKGEGKAIYEECARIAESWFAAIEHEGSYRAAGIAIATAIRNAAGEKA